MHRAKGFTLTEILVTVTIIALLAAIAIPGFTKTIEKAKAGQAITYLRLIRTAEKINYSRNKTYVPDTWTSGANVSSIATIRSGLGVELSDADWTFTVTPVAASFTATAKRTSGSATYKDKTIVIDQDGFTATGTHPYKPTSGTV